MPLSLEMKPYCFISGARLGIGSWPPPPLLGFGCIRFFPIMARRVSGGRRLWVVELVNCSLQTEIRYIHFWNHHPKSQPSKATEWQQWQRKWRAHSEWCSIGLIWNMRSAETCLPSVQTYVWVWPSFTKPDLFLVSLITYKDEKDTLYTDLHSEPQLFSFCLNTIKAPLKSPSDQHCVCCVAKCVLDGTVG